MDVILQIIIAILLFYAIVAIVATVLVKLGIGLGVGLGYQIFSIGKKREEKAVNEGKKPSKVLQIIGVIVMATPFIIIGVILYKPKIELMIDRLGYENCVDKWRNEGVRAEDAVYEIIDEFFEAAEAGDKETIIKLFVPAKQNSADFEKAVDEFLKEYPGNIDEYSFHSISMNNNGYFIDTYYRLQRGSEKYYVHLRGDSTGINAGLDYLEFNSEEGEERSKACSSEDEKSKYDKGIVIDVKE